jgi:hypothetical protein
MTEPFVVPVRTVPTTVVVASRVLAATALLLVADMVAYAYAVATMRSTVERVAPGVGVGPDAIEREVRALSAAFVVQIATLILFCGVLTMAALFSRLGRRSGQVLGILVAAPLLSCAVLPYLGSSGSALDQAVGNAQPDWANTLDLASRAVSLLALIAIALLLTKSARQWFSGLPPAPPGYMWVPAPLADAGWTPPPQPVEHHSETRPDKR